MKPILSKIEVLSAEEVDSVHQASLEILEEIGVEIPHREVLDLLREHGAKVDIDKAIAKLPSDLVLRAVHQVPKTFTMESPSQSVDVNDGKVKLTMCTCPYIFDYPFKERRLGKVEDILKSITIGNQLRSISTVQTTVIPAEYPAEVADVVCYQYLYSYCSKHCNSYIYSPESAEYILEMARIVAGSEAELRRRKFLSYFAESISPLRFSKNTIEIMLAIAGHELPISIGPMVTAGISGPVTLAGTLALENAEVLALIALIHFLNPRQPVYYGGLAHVGDMRHMRCLYGSPEQTLLSLAEIQMARHYGLACGCNVGLSDSNMIDFQAGLEKGVSVSLAAAAGAEFLGILGIAEQGFIGGGSESGGCLEQLVIDDEWIDYLNRIFRSFEVSRETLAIDVIKEVGIGGLFAGEEHTVNHFRDELWVPTLFNREPWGSWVTLGRKTIEERAATRVEELLGRHYPPTPVIEAKMQAELDRIADTAKQKLCVRGDL